MTIGVIGLGYVGLTLAIAAASRGIETYGVEINNHIKQCLSQNRAHFFEPGLDELINEYNGKTFYCVDQFPEKTAFDAFVITVGTPLKAGEKRPNFDYIKSALESIRHVYTGEQLIILRSTVSVGTTRNIVMPFLAQLCGKSQEDVLVAMCPERTVEGKAVEELSNLPQIISGNNERAIAIARSLFSKITSCVVEAGSIEEAELAKLYCNVYRDMTFALGNVLCMAAQTFGINGVKVIQTANEGYHRANIPLPGFVAGPCLEKDSYILTNNMPECSSRDFILSARHFNESLEDIVVNWVEKRLGPGLPEKVVVLSGMAFKGIPETSDLRGSSSVYIARKLMRKGYTLRLHDYVAHQGEMRQLELGEVYDSLEAACQGADVLLVLNNHRQYAQMTPFPALRQERFVVLDTWNVCTGLRNSGVAVDTLGNLNIGGALCGQL